MNARVEEIYVRGKFLGTITERDGEFEARIPGVPPTQRCNGWTGWRTRGDALKALKRAAK